MQCLLLPTTTPMHKHTHTHTHFNTGQSATRAAERQLRFRCCWFSVTLASERVRTSEANERPNLSAVGQQLKSHKIVVWLVGKRSTKTDGSAADVVVEEKAKMEWRESAPNDVRCRLGKGKWRQCVTWRKCALEAGCGAWCVCVVWWISLAVCSRALWSGEFAFAAPTATCCCCCCSLPLGFNWTCNVQRATATDSECPPKNSSAAADARVPQFSFIVDWALAYH